MSNKIKNTTLIVIIILILITLGNWGFNKYLKLKNDLTISNQNVSALKDSVRVTNNKIGEVIFSKEILVAKNKMDVKNLNDKMGKLVKKFKGEVNELTRLLGQIKSDTVYIENTKFVKLPDNTNGFTWNYNKVFDSENSRTLAGVTKFKFDSITNSIIPLGTTITKDEIKFDLIQGIRTRGDGKVEMFAMSNYPNFIASELNSVLIDPSTHPALDKFSKEKRLKIGTYAGYGITTNLSNYTVIAGPQIGVGIIYSFW